MTVLLRICDSCIHYNADANVCPAFPEGIPLKSDDTHFETLPGQVGDTIYDMDPDKYDEFEMYRRIHPDIKFPILLTYDIPEEGEVVSQQDVEVEEDEQD